jgi:hypothetical protein
MTFNFKDAEIHNKLITEGAFRKSIILKAQKDSLILVTKVTYMPGELFKCVTAAQPLK